MDFNLQAIFQTISKKDADQETMVKVYEIVDNYMKNPAFIFHLMQSLTVDLLAQQPEFYQNLQIMIKRCIQTNWVNTPTLEFWNLEMRNQIAIFLLETVFSVPHPNRAYFIEMLGLIIKADLRDSGNPHFLNELLIILQRLIELFTAKSGNFFDVNTSIQIATIFIKGCNRMRSVFSQHLDEQQRNQINTLQMHFINNAIAIINQCIPLLATNETACVICYNSIKIIRYSLSTIDVIVIDPNFHQVLTQICSVIQSNSDANSILKIKIQVFKLIDYLNSTFLAKDTRKLSVNQIQFAEFYKAQVIEPVIQLSINQLSLPTNFFLSRLTLNAFYQFVFYDMFVQSIITPEFVTNVLIPYSFVTPDDAEDAVNNPFAYSDTNLELDRGNNIYSTRTYCALILKKAISKLHFVEEIYPILIAEPKDFFEFEAKIFLFISYIKSVSKLEKEMRNAQMKNAKTKRQKRDLKNLPPITPHIQPEHFTAIIQQMSQPLPPFLLATLIEFASAVLSQSNQLQGIQMGVELMTSSDSPLVIYHAAKLFNSCTENYSDDLPTDINVLTVVEKIMPNITLFPDGVFPKVISTICQITTEHLTTLGPDLIKLLFEAMYENFANPDTMNEEGCEETLRIIYNIICSFNANAEQLPSILAICYEACQKILTEFPDFEFMRDLIGILALLNQRIHQNDQIQLKMLEFLYPLLLRDAEQSAAEGEEPMIITAAKELCQLIYPLITGPAKFLNNQPEVATVVTSLTENMINLSLASIGRRFAEEEEVPEGKEIEDPGDESDCMGYSLFLASCIIQVLGNVMPSFLSSAISVFIQPRFEYILEGNNFLTILGALYVLAAYLMIDPAIVAPLLTPEIMAAITTIITPKRFTDYREMVVAFIVLLNFTKFGYHDAYLKAATLFKDLIKYKRLKAENMNEDDDEEDEEEEEEDLCDDICTIIVEFPVPFDDFDAAQFFSTVSNETGLFSQLPEAIQAEIIQAQSPS